MGYCDAVVDVCDSYVGYCGLVVAVLDSLWVTVVQWLVAGISVWVTLI